MCYPKPGPRCAAHAREALVKAQAAYNGANPTNKHGLKTKLDEALNEYYETRTGERELRAEAEALQTEAANLRKEGRIGDANTKMRNADKLKDKADEGHARREQKLAAFNNRGIEEPTSIPDDAQETRETDGVTEFQTLSPDYFITDVDHEAETVAVMYSFGESGEFWGTDEIQLSYENDPSLTAQDLIVTASESYLANVIQPAWNDETRVTKDGIDISSYTPSITLYDGVEEQDVQEWMNENGNRY